MAHQNAEKVAQDVAHVLDRANKIRAAVGHPPALRDEAERLLHATPPDCDLLAWSPEGYNIALVASVLADGIGREIRVHHASLVEPLAPVLRGDPWVWISAEELLGLGEPRAWATAWAAARGGTPHDSVVSLALIQ
jgi:hypothetical protein